jgi:hypothetical protein
MTNYLFSVTQNLPAPEAVVEESDADRRDREAARLQVAPMKPGDDPPTHGDEGGGNLFSERASETARPPFFRRLFLRSRRRTPA